LGRAAGIDLSFAANLGLMQTLRSLVSGLIALPMETTAVLVVSTGQAYP
jgi:hypothetical protein